MIITAYSRILPRQYCVCMRAQEADAFREVGGVLVGVVQDGDMVLFVVR